jgi:DNA-binding LytR/AlgR family response regulator
LRMKYTAIIADDEKELRVYLRALLSEVWPELEICGEAAHGQEALKLVDSLNPQIAFLDIKMPGMSGLQAAKKIAGLCYIVFVTAYDQYAVEAFERNAVDYLVKPVTKKRLQQTVTRLKKQLQTSTAPSENIAALITQVMSNIQNQQQPAFLRWIKTQHKDSIRLISVDDVDYFQAQDKYTVVMTKEGEALIKKSIKELAEELNASQFWQIHRATIVNVAKIENVIRSFTGRGVIKLKGRKETLTISRNYLHLFKQM